MATRGRRAPPAGSRRPPPRSFPEAEELGSRELEVENKKLVIEVKSNEQGRFVKILETQTQGRGRIVFSTEKAFEFLTILNDFITEYEQLPQASEVTESERLKTESFSQGRRRYFVDLRQNQRGRFLKVTMLAGAKTFVAIPGEGLVQFRDALSGLLDEFGSGGDEEGTGGGGETAGGGGGGERGGGGGERGGGGGERGGGGGRGRGGGGGGGGGGPRGRRRREGTPPSSDNLPGSREVRAGGKTFYFDCLGNDRGTFIKLSEVLRSGRRTHLNIPHSCWDKMADVFSAYARDLPPSEEESSGTASDEN